MLDDDDDDLDEPMMQGSDDEFSDLEVEEDNSIIVVCISNGFYFAHYISDFSLDMARYAH